MSRKARVLKRKEIMPDRVYRSELVSRLINRVLLDGKKITAERLVYQALDMVKQKLDVSNVLEVLEKALDNIGPQLEVRSRRVGGVNYQIPMEVSQRRRMTLAIRWLILVSRARKEKFFFEKLGNEIIDAYKETGNAYKKKIDMHKMAESNKAFVHLRW